jgi:hypothetical protein
MNNVILLAALLAGVSMAPAQQSVPREESLKAAFAASLDLKQMLNTPIPTDPDVKRPSVVRAGDRGAMVLPESKLSAEALAKAGKEVVPIGQFWMRKITLQCEGQAARPDKLQIVTVLGREETTVALCALGVRKDTDGKLELLVYGKDKEPLLRTPLKTISSPQDNPIEMTGEQQGEGALVTLRILGKYEACFTVVSD